MANSWQIPPTNLVLTDGEVHIWRAKLDLSPDEIAELASILSEDEKIRANRFRFEQHQRRFIAARGILRRLLASYLNLKSDRLQFEYSSRGKPRIAASLGGDCWQFNLSHSEELAVYGLTRNCLIGIDLEYLREMDNIVKIAERFFSPQEAKLIASLTSDRQKQVFFQLWTAKEAYLKATGEGLAGSLDKVELFFEQQQLTLLSLPGDRSAQANWSIYPFVPENEYVATWAANSKIKPQQIKYWSWNY